MTAVLSIEQLQALQKSLIKNLVDEKPKTEKILSNEEYINRYITAKGLEGKTKGTLYNYRNTFNRILKYCDVPIPSITTDMLRYAIEQLQNETDCGNCTLDTKRRQLSSFFTWLVDEEYIIRNPMSRIHKIKFTKKVKKVYSDEELEVLREHCRDIRELAIVDVLNSTGMRVGELITLRWKDYDSQNHLLVIDKSTKRVKSDSDTDDRKYESVEVYPVLSTGERNTTTYYTKLNPKHRGHESKISSRNIEDLYDKIVAYYLDIETRNKTTIKDILEMAIEDLTPLTATRHRQIFAKHFSSISRLKISELSEKDIRNCLQAMLDRGIKSKAFNNATSTLNKINDFCVYNHINCINIREKISEFRKVKMVGKKVFIKEYKVENELAFSEKEAVELIKLAFLETDYINLAIAALITTGLRAGELLAITDDDVDLVRGILRIDKMENTKSYEIVYSCKDHSERTVYLNDDAIAVFSKVLELKKSNRTNCPFLFLNPLSEDNKLHLRALDNRLRKNQRILGFTSISKERSPHDCRRTYASIQYLHGVDIKTIQAQLGHSRTEQTWDYIKDIVDAETRAEKLQKGCILGA